MSRLSRLRRALVCALAVLGAHSAAQDTPAVHDSDNPAQAQLQSLAEGWRGLPRDRQGAPDWMAALRSGAIAPRAELSGQASAPAPAVPDVVMKNTKDMPFVRFPHAAHGQWLSCANCHDGLFAPKAGANPVSMDAIFRGRYCGACHGRVAFMVHLACERCHNIAHDGAKPWW
ncbi:MAG: c(7)-type cytochrome triheme domain-containing protein [Pseudomonadota bacterium]